MSYTNMKSLLFSLFLLLLTTFYVRAQTGREVHGVVTDSTKLSLPGTNVKLMTDKGDSVQTTADVNGKFVFQVLKAIKLPSPLPQLVTRG